MRLAEHHLQARFAPVAGQLDGDAVFPAGKASEVHVGAAQDDDVLVVFVGRQVAGDWDGRFPDARAGSHLDAARADLELGDGVSSDWTLSRWLDRPLARPGSLTSGCVRRAWEAGAGR